MITVDAILTTIVDLTNKTRGRAELIEPLARSNEALTLVVRRWPNRLACDWRLRRGRLSVHLGVYPGMGLADARAAAEVASARSNDVDRPIQHARIIASPTVFALFEAYVGYLEKAGKGGAYHARRLLLGPRGAANALGPETLACDVSAGEIRAHLSDIYLRGAVVEANSAHAWIRAAFSYGIKSAYSYTDAYIGVAWGIESNPAAIIKTNLNAFRPGQRFLREEEFVSLWVWLGSMWTERQRLVAAAIKLLMLTGQRPSEILRLSVDNCYFGEGVIEWSNTKNGRPHAIPMGEMVEDILRGIEPNEAGLFFPRLHYRAQEMKTTDVGNMLKNFCNSQKVKPTTPRDLRRTWKTLAGAAGVPKDIRDRIQNHAIKDVSAKHYDRYLYWREKSGAIYVWEKYVGELLSNADSGRTRLGWVGKSSSAAVN